MLLFLAYFMQTLSYDILFQQTNIKSLSYLINGNFCSIKHQPFTYKNKRQSILAHKIQNYFLISLSWAVVTFVVPNLSHSEYFNLPVTVDNKLLTIKKKGQSYFCIFKLTNMELCTYLSIPRVVVASLALILYVLTYAFQK